MKAIVLAGGEGRRLRPYSTILPKPLMPIGNKPVLEIIVAWLIEHKIEEVIFSVGYLSQLVEAYFNSGHKWGIKLRYLKEEKPLSTIGPLSLIKEELTEDFLVINGDTYTDLNLTNLISFHKEQGGIATIAAAKRTVNIDLGVIETDISSRVTSFLEKPKFSYLVSTGIYAFSPSILKYVPNNTPFGFDQLMNSFISNNDSVYTYVHNGMWYDIGREEDYRKVQEEYSNGHKHA